MRKTTVLIAVLLAVGLLCVPAAAEKSLSCEYIPIPENGFVADSFRYVDALYNLDGETLYCTELVERFYRNYYDHNLICTEDGPVVVDGTGAYFVPVDTPEPGDVLYGSAEARGTGYDHWAICRDYDAETGILTLFEQNWRWNGCAGIRRQLAPEENCYQAYRLILPEL